VNASIPRPHRRSTLRLRGSQRANDGTASSAQDHADGNIQDRLAEGNE
jgi:hypothetical protein